VLQTPQVTLKVKMHSENGLMFLCLGRLRSHRFVFRESERSTLEEEEEFLPQTLILSQKVNSQILLMLVILFLVRLTKISEELSKPSKCGAMMAITGSFKKRAKTAGFLLKQLPMLDQKQTIRMLSLV